MHDLIIVGGGPAGLSAALYAKRRGLDYLVLERGAIADTIYHYPIARRLFSTSNEVELEQSALPRGAKPTREEVLAHYTKLLRREQVAINTGEDVRRVARTGRSFLVETNEGRYEGRTVLLAIGGFGIQRKLGVAGESESRVSYQFVEAHPYAMKRVLVVGGGNSAAEAALYLSEAGAGVTLSIRRRSLDQMVDYDNIGTAASKTAAKIKPWVREPLERAVAEGLIDIILASEVAEIRPRSVLLRVMSGEGAEIIEIECHHVFALIGADPDLRLLQQAGAEIAADGRPVYTREFETTVPGLYVAGHLTRELHMKNAIETGRKVVDHIASRVFEESLTCNV
ncbi:MAG: NAD(P)-binding domain-containing protein [Blastocatellia bacterium]